MNNMEMENLLIICFVYENPGYLSIIEPTLKPYFVTKFYQASVQNILSLRVEFSAPSGVASLLNKRYPKKYNSILMWMLEFYTCEII